MVSFQQQETTEIRNRIRAAWATFHKKRQELTSRTYRLRHRLRLFAAVVSPTMNYASGTWTLTNKHTQRSETATSLAKAIPMMKWTQQRSKKKTGLST